VVNYCMNSKHCLKMPGRAFRFQYCFVISFGSFLYKTAVNIVLELNLLCTHHYSTSYRHSFGVVNMIVSHCGAKLVVGGGIYLWLCLCCGLASR